MMKFIHRSISSLEEIATNAPRNPFPLTLSMLQGIPTQFYIEEPWFLEIFTKVKKQAQQLEGDPLAGIAYYSAKIGLFDEELWKLFEMRFGRTNLPKTMRNISLVRTLEAFCIYSGETDEVAWTIEDVLVDRTKSFLKSGNPQPMSFHELSSATWALTHLGQSFEDLGKLIPNLLMSCCPCVGDDCLKLVWALAYQEHLKPEIVVIIKQTFEESLEISADLSLKAQANWALVQFPNLRQA